MLAAPPLRTPRGQGESPIPSTPHLPAGCSSFPHPDALLLVTPVPASHLTLAPRIPSDSPAASVRSPALSPPSPATMGVLDVCSPGVVTGEKLYALLKYAQEHKFAIPSVNCTSSSTINAALECARDVKSPIMIQFSNGGGAFYAGKGLSNEGQKAAVLGSVAGALHVRAMAEHYGVPVVLHSDHCAKKLLPWLDGTWLGGKYFFGQRASGRAGGGVFCRRQTGAACLGLTVIRHGRGDAGWATAVVRVGPG